MGELTNFGFYKPAEGEDGWASQVNNNADLLEDAFNANKTIPAIDTERGAIKSQTQDYHVTTDGSTITAVSQTDGLDSFIGETDIGDCLDKIIAELPPSGSSKEAVGTVHLGRGHFPGTLSSNVLPGGLWLIGSLQNNNDPGGTNGGLRNTSPGTYLDSDGTAFVPPNVDTDLATHITIKNMRIDGVGNTTGTGFDGTAGSNEWDWVRVENVNVVDFSQPFNLPDKADLPWFIRGCGISRFSGTCRFKNNTYISQTAFGPSDGGIVEANSAVVVNSQIHGLGESNPTARGTGLAKFIGCRWKKSQGGTNGVGVGVQLIDRASCYASQFEEVAEGWDTCIRINNGDHQQAYFNSDATSSSNSILFDGFVTEPEVGDNYAPNGIDDSNATRGIVNGKSFTTSASPGSGSQWDGSESLAHQKNLTVEDRSVAAPYPLYMADSAGNWIQIG